MPKGKTECYSNENVKVSTIEIIRTTFDTPVQEEFERETQDNDHSLVYIRFNKGPVYQENYLRIILVSVQLIPSQCWPMQPKETSN